MTKTRKFLVTLLSALLCLMLAFSMVACGGSGDGTGDGDGNNGGAQSDGSNLNQTQFNTAIDLSNVSYKCEGFQTAYPTGGTSSSLQTVSVYVPGKLFVQFLENDVVDEERYYEKSGNSYFVYEKEDGEWQKLADKNGVEYAQYTSNTELSGLIDQMGLEFSDFTYDATEKTFKYTTSNAQNICQSCTIKFVNSKPTTVTFTTLLFGVSGTMETTYNYSYNNVSVTLPNATHTHTVGTVSEYFDQDNECFPKVFTCDCGETVTRTFIEIWNAEDYIDLTHALAQEDAYLFDVYKIEFKADIDFHGQAIPSMKIADSMGNGYTFIGPEGGITLKNFTIFPDANGNAGMFSVVKSDLTIKNINIDGANIGAVSGCKYAGGFIAKIDIADDVATSGADITIENCKISNSKIFATTSGSLACGGIYGIAVNNLGENRTIKVQSVEVVNCDIECYKAAGALFGQTTDCQEVKTLIVNADKYSIKNCDIISSTNNEAGLYTGIVGDGQIRFAIQSADPQAADIIKDNTINGASFSTIGRDYGRTDWTEDNQGHCWLGISYIEWERGVHTTED